MLGQVLSDDMIDYKIIFQGRDTREMISYGGKKDTKQTKLLNESNIRWFVSTTILLDIDIKVTTLCLLHLSNQI